MVDGSIKMELVPTLTVLEAGHAENQLKVAVLRVRYSVPSMQLLGLHGSAAVGRYQLFVLINDTAVSGSPFTVTIFQSIEVRCTHFI